nr:hypothetical protein GCM10025732_25020 [Glycomyces mayteni]
MTTVDIPLRWLDDAAPDLALAGASCGVPLAPGAVADPAELSVVDDSGTPVPAQAWRLAAWPDGSVKWAGIALGAGEPADGYRVVRGPGPAPAVQVTVTETPDAVEVDTGAARITLSRKGTDLVRAVRVGDAVVAASGRLVSSRQDRPEPDVPGRTHAAGHVTGCEVEQHGPLRAVVRVTGVHREDSGREWLPFTVRLVFAAGAATFRIVHSFTWDGDPERDFLSSLGLRFTVPLRAALHDRHVRLAGADGGFLREAVRGLTGLRRDPGAEVRAAQLDGRPAPDPSTWDHDVARLSRWIPAWPDYTLRQPNANGYTIRKRTAADRPWIDAAQGTRADGLAYVGDPGGGLALGLTGFWQSHPTGLDVRAADTEAATLTLWLWSPDAEPMDLRFYHDGLGQDTYADQLDALEITYEDYEPGFGTAHGIARTHELTVTPYAATPPSPTSPASPAAPSCAPSSRPHPKPSKASSATGTCPTAPTRRAPPSKTASTSSSTSTSGRSSSAPGTGSGTSATSCTPTTPTATPGATTSAATPGTTPSSPRTCGCGPRSCAPAAPTSSASPSA